jgi:uncharacterized protein (TIGR02246 family)
MTANSQLEDEAAIRRLVAFYSDAVGKRDADKAASIYVDDGVVVIDGNKLEGRAAIAEGMRQTFAAYSHLHMLAHGPLIDIDGDRAKARWSTIEFAVRTGATGLSVIFGAYEDQLVRVSGGWRFKQRTFHLATRAMVDTEKLKFHPEFAHALEFAL